MRKPNLYNAVLIVLIIIEHLFLLYIHQAGLTSQAVNSIVCFSSSVLIGVVLLAKFHGHPEVVVAPQQRSKSTYIALLLAVACLTGVNMLTIDILKTCYFSNLSDIIPTIVVSAKQFVQGMDPYSAEAFVKSGTPPTSYFPMHWMPYCISEYFKFDPRTITFGIWALGASVVVVRSFKSESLLMKVVMPLLVFGSYFSLMKADYGIICATVETMVAGYYMLLIASLNQRNVYLAALMIGICLLSRYFVALWLPLWAFVLFVSGHRKQLLKTIIATTVFVSAVFIIPFAIRNWTYMSSVFDNYSSVVFREWLHVDGQGRPFHLYAGTGFAYLFFERYLSGNLLDGFLLLKKMMFIMPLAVSLIMAVWYWFHRKKIHYRIFLLASFKIYLSVFLAFVIVPYMYLSVAAIFISVAIFAEQARYKVGT